MHETTRHVQGVGFDYRYLNNTGQYRRICRYSPSETTQGEWGSICNTFKNTHYGNMRHMNRNRWRSITIIRAPASQPSVFGMIFHTVRDANRHSAAGPYRPLNFACTQHWSESKCGTSMDLPMDTALLVVVASGILPASNGIVFIGWKCVC